MSDLNQLPLAIATNPLRTKHKGLNAAVLTAAVDTGRGMGPMRMLAGTLQQRIGETDAEFDARVKDAVAQTRRHLMATYDAVTVEAENTLVLG